MAFASRQFTPDSDNARQLRDAFGRFSTGVTVVTVASEDGPIGMTANSFSSLSLDPALVLWSPAIGSRRYKYFANAEYFAIHILSDEDKHICEGFAKNGHAFDALEHRTNSHGVPLIESCLARFECRHVATHPGGDHVIVVGQVENVELRDGNPLTFYGGKYGKIQAA
ncbi:flavin reductase family protein [Falsihalocynthiibacter sp. S25ZX9]|uniref:flavin reductase family protein n=1 Tax=unclassified Falsihalocynthiibacter TaxID=2854191 RepID=UPI003510C389